MSNTQTNDLGDLKSPLLLFGGPYGNLAATQALRQRAEIAGFKPEQIICNGDLVAYCGEPSQTVELIRDWGIHVLQGNCEESLAALSADCGCGFDPGSQCAALSQRWYQVCSEQTTEEQRQWMGSLPRQICFTLAGVRFCLVHGSPASINEFIFPSTDAGRKQTLVEESEVDVVIGGHSGIPFGDALESGYWLNTGVIGLPANDGTPDGWYLTLEPQAGGISCRWYRLEYDSFTIQRKTEETGLDAYARTLETGLWPSLDILPETERRQTGTPLAPEELVIERSGSARQTGT